MAGKTIQLFLENVFNLAKKWCGSDFVKYMTSLLSERERLLRNNWRKLPPEDLISFEKKLILREIDFDTIISQAANYLNKKDFTEFLYEVSNLAIDSGELEKADRLLKLLIRKYTRIINKSLKANIYHKLGIISFYRNNINAALIENRKSLNIFTEIHDTKGITTVKNAMGILLTEKGLAYQGVPYFMEAKKMAQAEKFEDLLVKININLGNIFTILGSWNKAKNYYKDALKMFGKEEVDDTLTRIFHDIAIIHSSLGEYTKALNYLNKSIEYSKRINNPHMKALSYLEKAVILCKQGDFASATALATTAFQIFSEMGDRLSMADVYKVFGMINRDSKRFDIALSYFENSKRINKDYNNSLNLGETLLEMAALYQETAHYKKALECIKAAIKSFKRIEADARITKAKELLASLEK